MSDFIPNYSKPRLMVPFWHAVWEADRDEAVRMGLLKRLPDSRGGKARWERTAKADAWTVEIYARLQAAKVKPPAPGALRALGGMVVYLARKHLDATDLDKGVDVYRELAQSALYADHQFDLLDAHFGGGDSDHGFDGGGHHG